MRMPIVDALRRIANSFCVQVFVFKSGFPKKRCTVSTERRSSSLDTQAAFVKATIFVVVSAQKNWQEPSCLSTRDEAMCLSSSRCFIEGHLSPDMQRLAENWMSGRSLA